MARPIHADAEQTRRRILDAGVAAFGRHGLGGTTVRQIAELAGITFATVHHYFGTKERLHAACLDQAFDELAGVVLRVGNAVASAPAEDKVSTGVSLALAAARERPERSRFLLRAFVFEDAPEVRERVTRAQREMVEHMSRMLKPAAGFGRRIPLVGLGILLTRFAVSPEEELALFAEETGDETRALQSYLCHVASQTLEL